MKLSLKNISYILATVVLFTALAYGLVTKLVAINTQSVATEIANRIALQTKNVATIAEATKQNLANESVAQVIKDCAPDKRKKFDTLLDKLSSSITASELSELTGLFYQCGNFYAQQRSMMSLVLSREVTLLTDTYSLATIVSEASSTQTADLKEWQDIANDEAKIAQFFNQLVDMQGSIIFALGSGKTASSPEVTSALAEVTKINGQMVVLSKQVEEHRAAISSL